MNILGIIASSRFEEAAPVAGYAFGGGSSAIDKLDFSAETRSTLAAIFTAALGPVGVSNSGTAGYFQGANVAVDTAIRKLLFATDGGSTLAATVANNRVFGAGVSNKGSAGYWMAGGPQTNDFRMRQDIEKLTYSAETTSVIGATFTTVTIYNYNGMSDDGTAGYSYGGSLQPSNTFTNTIQKLLFSTEARTQLANTSTETRNNIITGANKGVAGYAFGGGDASTYATTIQKMPFATETPANLGVTLALSNSGTSTCDARNQASYIMGGYNLSSASPGPLSTIVKMNFTTDVNSTLGATLSISSNIGAVSNGSA